MFGKSLLKVFGLALAGAVVLAAGTQLLSSAIAVVISFRYGDFLPFVMLATSTVILLRIPRMLKEDSSFRAIQMVLAYAATSYLVLVVFILLLPYGVVASLAGSSLSVIVCSLIHDPREISRLFADSVMRDGSQVSGGFGRASTDRIGASVDSEVFARNHVFQVAVGHEDKVIAIMRERPLLPISLTRYEDFSVVIASTGSDTKLLHQIKQLLGDEGIDCEARLAPLFLEAILKLPLIDEQFGLSMEDFCIVSQPHAIEYLLKNWVTRMTAFSSKHGFVVIIPRVDASGLAIERIPTGREIDALFLHDYSSIKESVESGATTT